MLFQSVYLTAPSTHVQRSESRQGTVLLIVLVVLTLFAAVGLAFLFYAESEASSALAFRQQFDFRGPDMDPELAFSLFMQQLIFDCRDDGSGLTSALRGHGFYRNMYGMNYISSGGNVVLATPLIPYNGTGRQHWNYGDAGMPPPPAPFLSGVDDYGLINYAYCPTDGFVRFPERLGTMPAPPAKGGLLFTPKFVGGANPPYSAADPNFMALAAMKADGTILVPSFHRDWIPNGFGSLDPSNPNWKAADPKLKYMVLRPRPGDHPFKNGKLGFPMPLDAFGDVRNRPITWAGVGNDSFWMYTGAPILTLPDGRRYTALFAPLIVDLDGKLNITVAGNLCGNANDTPCGNSGLAPSEMNPARILSDPTAPNEWKNLLLGMKTPTSIQRFIGRYGTNMLPGAAGSTAPSPVSAPPHFYAWIDTNGRLAPNNGPNTPWTFPTAPYQMWPNYSTGYTGLLSTELTNHPMTYNPMTSVNGDRIILASELNLLYRYGDTNTDAMLSDLWQLLPVNLKDVRKRNMITTLSFDRREPGYAPWLYTSASPNRYELAGYVAGGPAVKPAAPALASAKPGTALGKEYDQSWRNNLPQLLKNGVKLDLSMPVIDAVSGLPRALKDYPTPVANQITDTANFTTAQQDRQIFAATLFQILVKATGAFDPITYDKSNTLTTPTSAEIDALRYLAQLAVNIVDYIDTDDYITPFNWVALGNGAFQTDYATLVGLSAGTSQNTIISSWVYGTELPRVVLNEAYCEYGNDTINDPLMTAATPAANKVATYYNVDIWAELCNPFKADATLFASGSAHLFAGTTPAYRLLVTDKNVDMHKPTNTDGRPDTQPATGAIDLTNVKVKTYVDSDFNKTPGTTSIISPIGTAFQAPTDQGSNTGFYMVGPADSTNTAVPFPNNAAASFPKATLDSKGMRYKFTLPVGSPLALPVAPTLMLQRLLCPYLPHDSVPTNPTYNPYITVDYFEDVTPYKAITQNGNIGAAGIETPVVVDQRKSLGRVQPYARSVINQVGYAPNQPQHTFFYHNFQATAPTTGNWPPNPPASATQFKWLVHLDRNLISPMELLHVSANKPHELTQYFTGLMNAHQAPWFDNTTRLSRFFEFVQTTPRMAGTNGPRIPGKININTVWDLEVFLAMCDPMPANHFNATDVAGIWTQLKALRNTTGGAPGVGDQYFLPLSAGVVPAAATDALYPSGSGIANTLLRPFNTGGLPDSRRLFELEDDNGASFPNRTHPYQRLELLTKIYNNMTTRSNCFAVWCTVGFFEVNDVDPQGRIYLGQEIGQTKGTNIRHKMFAIVDRSVLDATPPTGSATLAGLVQDVLNQKMPFNPHATMYKELVPYFMVVE